MFFFFQAEDGIRDWSVTGVQTCALPIYISQWWADHVSRRPPRIPLEGVRMARKKMFFDGSKAVRELGMPQTPIEIGRASCRERVEMSVVAGTLKKQRNKQENRHEKNNAR